PPMTRRHVLAGVLDCPVSTPSRTEAVARIREGWIEDGLQNLQESLLDHPVDHRQNGGFKLHLPQRVFGLGISCGWIWLPSAGTLPEPWLRKAHTSVRPDRGGSQADDARSNSRRRFR